VKEAISLQLQGGGQAAVGDVGEGNPRAIWRSLMRIHLGPRARREELTPGQAGCDVGIVDALEFEAVSLVPIATAFTRSGLLPGGDAVVGSFACANLGSVLEPGVRAVSAALVVAV